MLKPNDPFDLLLDASRQYEREKGIPPVWISGWKIEDKKITPPQFLEERLIKLPARAEYYSYINELHEAKECAASLLSPFVQIEGKPLSPQNIAIFPSSTQGLLLILTAFRDLLAIHRLFICAPDYFAFRAIGDHLGLDSVMIPANTFYTADISFDQLKIRAQGTGQAVLLTNPAYGVGIERSVDDYQRLFSAVPDGNMVLCDETSLGLSWDNLGPWSPIDLPNHVCLLRSPTKLFLLPGRKSSFLVASSSLVKYIENIAEYLVGSIAGNTQEEAITYFQAISEWQAEVDSGSDGPWKAWKYGIIQRLRSNLLMVGNVLRDTGFQLSPINSGYYVLAGQAEERFKCANSLDILRSFGVVYTWSDGFGHVHPSIKAFRVNLANDPGLVVGALNRSLPTIISACSK